jgi:O-antigen/teichoic acid export membrane protein
MLRRLTPARALQIFQIIRLGVLILSSVVLAKSHLSTASIGVYETLTWLGTTLTLFWTIGLLQGFVALYGRYQAAALAGEFAENFPETAPLIQKKGIEYVQKSLVFNTFFVFCLLSFLLFLFLIFGQKIVFPWLAGLEAPPDCYGWFCTGLLFSIPAFVTEYIYLVREKTRAIVWWGVLSFGGQLVTLALAVNSGLGIDGAFMAWALWSLLRFFWAFWVVWRYSVFALEPALIRAQWHFSRPLVWSIATGNLILFFDNWLVGWYYRDEAIFAVFRYGAREFPLATALTSALSSGIIPALSANFPVGLDYLKKEGRRLMHLLFPLAICLMFVAGALFPVVFNPEFTDSAPLFNIYLLITASRLLIPAPILLVLGQPRIIFYTGIAELVVKVITGFVFIHLWGLSGLAFSVVLSYWVEKIGLIWYLEKRCHIPTRQWLDVRVFLLYCLLLAGIWVLQHFQILQQF